MGTVMRRRGARAFSRGRRLTAGSPTHRGGAGGAEMRPKPHLSGQPGGCHVNVLPDKPKVKDGSLRERAQPGAQKYPRKDFVSLTR